MQNGQKKPYKKYYAKSKTYASDNYEYDSYGHSSYPNTFYKPTTSYKYSKTKKHYNEYNTYQPVNNNYVPSHKQDNSTKERYNQQSNELASQDKWLHDKYSETIEVTPPEANYTGNKEPPKSTSKLGKKPDRQLYSVREKHTHGDDLSKSEINPLDASEIQVQSEELESSEGIANSKTEVNDQPVKANAEKSEQVTQTSIIKEILRIGDEGHPIEEDKSFVSNVSTAIPDKLKNCDDDSNSKEKKVQQMTEVNQGNRGPPPKLLFEILLESDKYPEKIRIYENEENYENLLEKICRNHNFTRRMGLYFKINLLQMIFDRHYDKSRIEPILKNYIAINSKLILYENGFQEIDDSIRPYIDPPSMMMIPSEMVFPQHNMNMHRRPENPRFISGGMNTL